MKPKIPVVLAFVAGLVLGALFSPWRYQLATAGEAFAYRLDRLTGTVRFISAADYPAAAKP